MKKKTIINLTFISVIFTTIYILVSYFGIVRYLLLHKYNCKDYTEQFNKLEQPEDTINIVLYTDKPNKITPTINSLLDQTIKVNQIKVILPYKNNTNIQKDIKNTVWIQNVKKDRAELNAIVPALLQTENDNDILIIVKDDMIYGKDFVEDMIDAHKKHTDTIIYARQNKPNSGILIKPNFFKNDFVNTKNSTLRNFIEKYKIVKTESINYFEIYKRL